MVGERVFWFGLGQEGTIDVEISAGCIFTTLAYGFTHTIDLGCVGAIVGSFPTLPAQLRWAAYDAYRSVAVA